MPFTVQDLIKDKPAPVAIEKTESVQTALELMIKGDFSQLPVVSKNNCIEGIITSDSIIHSLNHLDLSIGGLGVEHATRG